MLKRLEWSIARRLVRGAASVSFAALAGVAACGGASDASTATITPPNDPPKPPAAPPVVVLSFDSLAVQALAGAKPVTAVLQVSGGSATALTGLAAGAPAYVGGSGWLTTSISATTAPATITIAVDPGALSAGSYSATIPISATGADPKPVRVRVDVRARPVLQIDNALVALRAGIGDSAVDARVAVSTSSDTIGALALGQPDCGGNGTSVSRWLTASLSRATTPATIALHANTSGLAAGTYTCTTSLATTQPLVDSATRAIVTTLQVHAVPAIAFSSPQLAISMQSGSATWTTDVLNGGTGVLDRLGVGAISYEGGATKWISSATLSSSAAPASLSVSVATAGLAIGVYNATIAIVSGADDVAQRSKVLPVKLTVTNASGGPAPPLSGGPVRLIASPSSFSVSCRVGQMFLPMGTFILGMSDGSTTTLAHVSSSATGPYEAVMWGPAYGDGIIPMTVPVEVHCLTAGTFVLQEMLTTASGYSTTMTYTVNVSP